MITKVAFFPGLGVATGALRADDLTAEDRKNIAKAYGLSEDSSYRTRGAIRGEAGNFLGTLGGGFAGAMAGAALEAPELVPVGMIAGGLYGSFKGSDRYSKEGAAEARRILAEQRKRH